MNDFKGSFDCFNVLDGFERGSDSSMEAKNFIFGDGSQGQPIKKSVDPVEDGILVFGFFVKFFGALVSEAEVDVDLAVFVVSSDEVDLLGVGDFESQEQADRLDGMVAPVDEIPQEYVIVVLDVLLFAVFMWGTIQSEESHQVGELSVNVAEYFERSPH